MKDSVIIVSGGMDSITLLYEKKNDIALAVSFDYGSPINMREIQYAKYHCAKLAIKHITVELKFLKQYLKSPLLQGGKSIPVGNLSEDEANSTIIPFRNGIMLSIACGIAESNGLKHVLIATHLSTYPDCSDGFIRTMSNAMTLGTVKGISVLAPYSLKDKCDIIKIGNILGIDYAQTYSCYTGNKKHCGVCKACVERICALKKNEILDTTEYEFIK
jgi:7-cyano-7-deazaguanine synthase